MNIQEIEQKIVLTNAETTADEESLLNIRAERAKLVVENDARNNPKIDALDRRIDTICCRLANAPAITTEYKSLLTEEKTRLAEVERDDSLSKQLEIVDEIQVLSRSFVSLLEKANNVNVDLRNALTAEAAIQMKTGQDILTEFAHGSAQSLLMLLEKSQAELSGIHTAPTGPGIVLSASPIQL